MGTGDGRRGDAVGWGGGQVAGDIVQRSSIGRVRPRLERTAQRPGSAAEAEHRRRDALRLARSEAAERTGVVVELHDAEVARLELLNEALDPIFADIPQDV